MRKIYLLIFALSLFCCTNDGINSNSQNKVDNGQGGSLARFLVLHDYLYTVDNNSLNVFNITNPESPVKVNRLDIGFNIETLSNYDNYLYIGSRNGMYIYDAQNPEEPQYLSEVQHFTACDPVVANKTNAFVTLHADIGCGNTINALQIYDISNVLNPILISIKNLTKPIGLGLYNDYLFVCDDEVKIFDVTDPRNTFLVNSIDIDVFDVIIYDNLLVLIGNSGLYQYKLDPEDIENIESLSQLNI